jgi:hypothetical protein
MDCEHAATALDSEHAKQDLDSIDTGPPLDRGIEMSCDTGPTQCIRKHIESNDTYYVDLAPKLGTGETVSSVVSVTCSDAALTAANAVVLSAATTITTTERDLDGNTTTTTYVIAANKGVSFTLTGGTVGAGCSTITVKFTKSTGKSDAEDVHVLVYGQDV